MGEAYWLKLIRAEELLHAVAAEVAMYQESDPYRLVGKFDPDGTSYVLRVELNHAPPGRLAVLTGECVQAMRSALDHLACVLAKDHDPTVDCGAKHSKTQFPILDVPPKRNGKPIRPSVGATINEAAATMIEGAQPYGGPKMTGSHPLALLRDLSNADAFIGHGSAHVVAGTMTMTTLINGTFDDGAVIATFPVSWEDFRAEGCLSTDEVKVYGYGSVLVTLPEPGVPDQKPVTETLQDLLVFIKQFVKLLEATMRAPDQDLWDALHRKPPDPSTLDGQR